MFINNAKAEDIYYTVVISSVKSAQSAQKLANDMIKKGFEANVMLVSINTGNTNRVCIGKSSTKAGAEEIQRKLAKAGYSSSWIAVINEPNEQIVVIKKQPEKKPYTEVDTYTVDVITAAPIAKKSKSTTVDVLITEKNNKLANTKQNPKTAMPAPPDVDKLPLALPKAMLGNSSTVTSSTFQTKGAETTNDVITSDVYIVRGRSDEGLKTYDITTGKEVTVYRVDVSEMTPSSGTSTSIITSSEEPQVVTYDVITSVDTIVSPHETTTTIVVNSPDSKIISEDILITRNDPFSIKSTTVDTLEMIKAPKAESKAITEGTTITTYTVTVDDKNTEVKNVTPRDVFIAKNVPESTTISVAPIETEKNPTMESKIPGTNLSYTQFYTEIKKIFYALEKYSLASGTLLNEYIEPTYGTYIRYRNIDKVYYEKMIKPKDVYKNPQVKSNVLMFFQDMVKVRRQPAVIGVLPQYDCALKHIPGLDIYLSSLAKDNKFYGETVASLKSSGVNLTDEENQTILAANRSINAAFVIGSAELVKAVYFAIEGEKVYLRYIDMYDNCDKK